MEFWLPGFGVKGLKLNIVKRGCSQQVLQSSGGFWGAWGWVLGFRVWDLGFKQVNSGNNEGSIRGRRIRNRKHCLYAPSLKHAEKDSAPRNKG